MRLTPDGSRLSKPSKEARRRSGPRVSVLIASALALAILFAGASSGLEPGGPSGLRPAEAANPTDQIIVKFRSNASEVAIDSLNASMAVQQVGAIPALGMRVIRVPYGWTAEQVVERYGRNPLVEFAEIDALVEPEVTADDPNFSNAWHLPKIEVPAAWDETKATGVMIAVCDTGVASVPDLTPVLRGDLGWNAADGSSNYADYYGHGTKVAGAAAATANNSIGVTGVAWGAQILPVRISNSSGGSAYVSDAAKCITYAADKGARVINLSYRMASYAAIDTAARYAQDKGAVTVVAAGNDGSDPGWPSYPGFLAVGATDKLDAKTSWSNYGSFVDVTAPGVNIMTTRMDGSFGLSSGTSLSAPVAAGVLGLILGAKPSLSAQQAEVVLMESADDLGAAGWDPYFGAGRINAREAVLAAQAGAGSPAPTGSATPSPSPTSTASPSPTATPTVTSPGPTTTSTAAAPTPTPTATPPPPGDTTPPNVMLLMPAAADEGPLSGNVKFYALASDNVGVTAVAFYIDGAFYRSSTGPTYSVPWNTRKASSGSHVIEAIAYDAAGNSASDSIVVTVQ